jgi:WD40 repeat protein
VAFSPDGYHLVSGSADSTIKVWHLRTGQQLRQFTGHSNWVNAVAFAAKASQAIVSGSADGTVKVWSVED